MPPSPTADAFYPRISDDQLRAECSGRGIGHVSEPMCTIAERDEWIRVGIAWSKRAEAAEAALSRIGEEPPAAQPSFFADELRMEWERRAREQHQRVSEPQPGSLGPLYRGIQFKNFEPRVDNSIAFLDEDLLCEDA